MPRILTIAAASVLFAHGLIHLMGTSVYLRQAEIKGLAYKTTVLGGRWDLGEAGMRVFGALWMLPAIGFVVAALALLAAWGWWRPVLVAVTLLSLALTTLDWRSAFMGAIVDVAILALVPLAPRMAQWFP